MTAADYPVDEYPTWYFDKPRWQPWAHWGRVTATITAPGKQPVVINTAAVADMPTVPTAIGQAVISWSSPTVRDHQDAGGATLTLITDRRSPDWLNWDARVTIDGLDSNGLTPDEIDPGDAADAVYGGGWWHQLFVGWVEDITTTRRPHRPGHPPTWQHVIRCADAIGRAAGTMIGDTPWTVDGDHERYQRIRDVSPWPAMAPWPIGGGAGGFMAGRDIDNFPLIDLITEWGDATLRRAFVGADGLINLVPLPGNQLADFWGGSADYNMYRPIITLDASQLAETPTVLARSGKLTRVRIGYAKDDPDNVNQYIDGTLTVAADHPGMSSVASISTNLIKLWDETIEQRLAPHIAYAKSLLAAETHPRFAEPVRVILQAIIGPETRSVIRELASLENRGRHLVKITHPPAGIYPMQRVIGATITLAADPRDQRLELTLEPATAGGQRQLTFDDLERIRYYWYAQPRPAGAADRPITFDDIDAGALASVTIDDTLAHTPPPETP